MPSAITCALTTFLLSSAEGFMLLPSRPTASASRVRATIAMTCDWDAMMKELCAPSEPSLTALSDHFSPAQRCERERREGVRVLEVGHESMSIEEIICTETHCIALSYTVPRNQAQATLMASERGEEVKNEKDQASRQHWQHELRNLLNASPGVVRSLVRRHAPHCLRPTEEIEMAMVPTCAQPPSRSSCRWSTSHSSTSAWCICPAGHSPRRFLSRKSARVPRRSRMQSSRCSN